MRAGDCLAPSWHSNLYTILPWWVRYLGLSPCVMKSLGAAYLWMPWCGCAYIGAINWRDRQPSCTRLIYSKDVSLTAISISKCSHLLKSMHKILALTAAQACCTRASKGPLARCHRDICGVEGGGCAQLNLKPSMRPQLQK